MMTNESGEIVFDQDYLPFGGDLAVVGDLEPVNDVNEGYKYTGQREETSIGLYYYGARFYDPELGRFITEDTYQGEVTDSQSQNIYLYVMNNPMKYVDPSGHKPRVMKSGDKYYFIPTNTVIDTLVDGSGLIPFVSIVMWGTEKILGYERFSEDDIITNYNEETKSVISSTILDITDKVLNNSESTSNIVKIGGKTVQFASILLTSKEVYDNITYDERNLEGALNYFLGNKLSSRGKSGVMLKYVYSKIQMEQLIESGDVRFEDVFSKGYTKEGNNKINQLKEDLDLLEKFIINDGQTKYDLNKVKKSLNNIKMEKE